MYINYFRTVQIMASASKNKLFHEDKERVELQILNTVRNLIIAARKTAAQNINTLQVITNFEIGRIIVENEQSGKIKAEYGKKTLIELSKNLTEEFGREFSKSNLEYMRRFFIDCQCRFNFTQLCRNIFAQFYFNFAMVSLLTGGTSPVFCRSFMR